MAYAAPVPSSPPVASANYANSAGSANTANYANTAGYAETGGLPPVSDIVAAYSNNGYNPTNDYVAYEMFCRKYIRKTNENGTSDGYTYDYYTSVELIAPHGFIGSGGSTYCYGGSPISVFSPN